MKSTMPQRWSPAKVRLSDSAVLAGVVSLSYAACLMAFPRDLPLLLHRTYYAGYFFRMLAILLVVSNGLLFVLICKRRSQKPNLLTLAYIAFLTITLVVIFRALVVVADEQAQVSYLLLHQSRPGGIGSEELLLYTHLGIVSGIFLPNVLVRLTQDYAWGTNSREPDTKSQAATMGQ